MAEPIAITSIIVAAITSIIVAGISATVSFWTAYQNKKIQRQKNKFDTQLQDQKYVFESQLQRQKDEVNLLIKAMDRAVEEDRQNSENVRQDLNRQHQRELTWLNIDASKQSEMQRFMFESERAEQDARRAYLIEAHKRLYQEFEPLAFQLNELSDTALSCIRSLASNAKEGSLKKDDTDKDSELLSSDKRSYFVYVIYSLLAPLAVTKLMLRRLTLFDLTLNPSIEIQYRIAKALYYYTFTEDKKLAQTNPSLEYDYNPLEKDASESRQGVDAAYT